MRTFDLTDEHHRWNSEKFKYRLIKKLCLAVPYDLIGLKFFINGPDSNRLNDFIRLENYQMRDLFFFGEKSYYGKTLRQGYLKFEFMENRTPSYFVSFLAGNLVQTVEGDLSL